MSQRRPSLGPTFWLLAAGLLVATVIAFAPVRHHDFVSVDDHIYVTDNPRVLAGLAWSSIAWAFTTSYANFWHPLTWLSLMLDVEMFGASPGALHVTNLVLHLGSVFVLFLALVRMTGAVGRSAFVAALFALHPLHVESVAWVSERKDVLSTLFLMLALWSYAGYAQRRGGGHRALPAYLVTLALFALGLMAKPMLVTLPFALLLLDWWPLGRATAGAGGSSQRDNGAAWWRAWVSLLREKIPFFALAAASGVVAFIAQRTGGAVAALESFPLAGRVANALHSYLEYVVKMVWPTGLIAFYPYPQQISAGPAILALIAILVVSALVIRFAPRYPYLAVGWFWYVGTLLPVSGLVQVGSHAMADRYTYVPLIGLFIAIAWGAFDLVGRARSGRVVLAVAACVIVAALGVTTRAQVMTWKNSVTLWRHALDVVPGNYYAHNGLGLELDKQGRTSEAMAHFREASRLAPGFPNGHNNLGLLLANQGRTDEALAEYREALRLAPDYLQAHLNLGNALSKAGRVEEASSHYAEAVRLKPDSVDARTNLGNALLVLGRVEEAVGRYRQALTLDPGSAPAHYNLGNALQSMGRLDEAVGHYLEALAHHGDSVQIRNNLGATLERLGRFDEALAQFQAAIRLDPESAQARNNLGNVFGQMGRPADAAEQYRDALRIDPTYADAHMNLGSVLADSGRLEEAEREHRQAVALNPRSANAHYNLASTLQQRGRLEEAVVHYNETLRLEGPSVDLHRSLAATFERMGRAAEAEEHYREALRLQPNQPDAAAGLARVSSKLGKRQDR